MCRTDNKVSYYYASDERKPGDGGMNHGRETEEVVQVYIKNVDSSLAVPNPELAAFTPVFLKAGETKTITLSIAPKAFTVVDETGARTEDGSHFHIYVGCTQPDKRSMELAGVKPVEIEYSK